MKIFVAHPYTLPQLPIEDYRQQLTTIQRNFPSVKFTFADERIESVHILEKIERMITEADFSLFDVTSWNANVALELGLAIGLRRSYYILFNDRVVQGDVPSDIKGMGRLQYTSLSNMQSQLSVLIQSKIAESGFDARGQVDQIQASISDCLKLNGPLTMVRLAEKVQLPQGIVKANLSEMLQKNLLVTTGATKGTKYDLKQSRVRKSRA